MVIKNKTKLREDLPTLEETTRDMEQKEEIKSQTTPKPNLTHRK